MATASRGAGTMRERPPGSGHWQLRVFMGYDRMTGHRRQATRTFVGSKREASVALAKMVAELYGGAHGDGTRATVGELLDAWLEHIRPTRRPKTVYEAERSIEARIRPRLGHIRLDRLSPRDLDLAYMAWLSDGLAPTSVRRLHAVLSASLNLAERWDWVSSSPAKRSSPPIPSVTPVKIPTPDQLVQLIEEAANHDPVLAAAITIAALTGARRGELCALRWWDIDLGAGRMRIARSLTRVGSELFEGPTKTHQVRDVALDDFGQSVLKARLTEMTAMAESVGETMADDAYVLSYHEVGAAPVDPDSLTSGFSRLCRRLDARPRDEPSGRGRVKKPNWAFRFHDLRHFSVSTLIAAGIDVRTVAERHGHAQTTMTLNRYAHALPERDRQAASIIGGILRRPAEPPTKR